MRKQAEQLVVGRVYADTQDISSPSFFEYTGISENGKNLMKFVGGEYTYSLKVGEIGEWAGTPWFELTPEEDAIYNKPPEPTFTLSDIQRVIERIENKAKANDHGTVSILFALGLRQAIEIMREELKLK